jgi:hypothetical protein
MDEYMKITTLFKAEAPNARDDLLTKLSQEPFAKINSSVSAS